MKTDVGIYGNMHAADTPRYRPGLTLEKPANDHQIRQLLRELISSSSDLSIRVWLDGIYTNVEDSRMKGAWMDGREVYFKVEGSVPGTRDLSNRMVGGS